MEAESELPGRLIGRCREARYEGAVEATDAGPCLFGVNRGLPTREKQKENEEPSVP